MQLPPGAAPSAPRSRRKVDWELVSCGLGGHALVGTDAAGLRPEDAILARDEEGLRWHRCLRCDAWVALPQPSPTAREHPPDRGEIAADRRMDDPHHVQVWRSASWLSGTGCGDATFLPGRRAAGRGTKASVESPTVMGVGAVAVVWR